MISVSFSSIIYIEYLAQMISMRSNNVLLKEDDLDLISIISYSPINPCLVLPFDHLKEIQHHIITVSLTNVHFLVTIPMILEP